MEVPHHPSSMPRPRGLALLGLVAGATALALLLLRNNYQLFHCMIEMVAVAVAGSVTMIAWNTRSLRRNDYILFLGLTLGGLASMVLVHTLSHPGMAVFEHAAPDAAGAIQALSRVWFALGLAAAPWYTQRRARPVLVLLATLTATLLITGGALHSELLTLREATTGEPTPQRRLLEGAAILLLLVALATHWRARARFDQRVLAAVCGAILLAVASQICLVSSRHYTDAAAAAAHIVELLCFVLLYWALVRLNLSEPYTVIFRELVTNLHSLEHEANRDQLTGLYNRRGLEMLGDAQLALAQRLGLKVSVIFADLNGLKRLNDEHGHAWGDQALVDTATLLRSTFRDADMLARIGGDEFVVLLLHGDGAHPLRRLRRAIAQHAETTNRPYTLSLAIGVAQVAPGQPGGLAEVLRAADAEMYSDKLDHYATTEGEPRR
jgi:diguanylate cyclase (GGDEF)-like protein